MPFFFGAGFFAGAAVGLFAVAVGLTVEAAGFVAVAAFTAGVVVVVDEFVVGAAAGVSTIGVTSVAGLGIGLAVTEEI